MALPLRLFKPWARSQPIFASLCKSAIDLESGLDTETEMRIALLNGVEVSVEQKKRENVTSSANHREGYSSHMEEVEIYGS